MARRDWIEGSYRVAGGRRPRRWIQMARQVGAVAFAIAGGLLLNRLITPPVHAFVTWLFALWNPPGG